MVAAIPPNARAGTLIILGIDGTPLGFDSTAALVGTVEPRVVTRDLGIREVPSVLTTDSACHVVRRAIGPTASDFVLDALARKE
jgi:hypothetical protein